MPTTEVGIRGEWGMRDIARPQEVHYERGRHGNEPNRRQCDEESLRCYACG